MKKVKLTKTELKKQKDQLKRYNRYLPTLYIKKQKLQTEIEKVRTNLSEVDRELNRLMDEIAHWMSLLGEDVGLNELIELKQIEIKRENIAGVDIPVFVQAQIDTKPYDLYEYPLWVDKAIAILKTIIYFRSKRLVLTFQKRCLQKELRVTSQRVNLFEKVKIPETREAIRKIVIYLGDQRIAEVGWAITAKKKIEGTHQ
ncbi:MAG: V-type ATP synthase subunit D [Thermodesulfobacteriota bacterium]|nr:V-type ATP synthase subunit D [Thermodesulfobacteriota bacterium]